MHKLLVSTGSEDRSLTANRLRERYTTERTLKNGLSVVFRPIEPTDKARYNDFFKALSPESIHMRFFGIIKELSDEALEEYCNLDYNREMAIVAQPKGESEIIATARLVFANQGKAEFDIAVADAYQGLGLGSELMKYSIQVAQDYKLKEIYEYVSTENYKMVSLSKKLGFRVKSTEADTIEMSLQLT